ncbi:hypothetical protein B0H13DRAFT_1877779 [Mycena leptocephala]|nr:hypothetical protein B0H13DRAFT_1877779 [Mycena leptocephala]
MTSQLPTSVRKLQGCCTGTTSWSNKHDITAYWDYQPGHKLGTTSPVNLFTATRNSGIGAGTAETAKEQIKRTTGNSQRAMRAQTNKRLGTTSKKLGTAMGILGTANGQLGTANGKLGTTNGKLGSTASGKLRTANGKLQLGTGYNQHLPGYN